MFNLNYQAIQEVTIKQNYLGQDIVNVFHFRPVSNLGVDWPVAGTPPTSTELMDYVALTIVPAISLQQSTALTYISILLRQVVGVTLAAAGFKPLYDLQDVRVFAAGSIGGVAGDMLPSYAAVTRRKQTAVVGRRFRGSTRFAGIVEAQTQPLDGNRLQPIPLAAWVVASDTIRTLFRPNIAVANEVQEGVMSLVAAGVAGGLGAPKDMRPYTPIVTASPVNTGLGSQVSRKLGHGS